MFGVNQLLELRRCGGEITLKPILMLVLSDTLQYTSIDSHWNPETIELKLGLIHGEDSTNIEIVPDQCS